MDAAFLRAAPAFPAGAVAVFRHDQQWKEMGVMPLRYFEVDVPTKHNDQPGQRIHIFVGLADDPLAARNAAHDAHDKARLLHQAGQEIPHEFVSGWGARGLRPDWDLDWNKATATPWVNPHGLFGTRRTF